MKKSLFAFLMLCFISWLPAQNSGNINYQGNSNISQSIRLPDNNIGSNFGNRYELIAQSKGLYNLKADHHVAIFNIVQIAKGAEEVNQLMDSRIEKVREQVKALTDTRMHVDMLSFVPVYEYEVEKKVFSKKTYNEIPTGFELKKNLHIEYQDPEVLNKLISICAEAEIYDMVRVDYLSLEMEKARKELRAKAKKEILEKMSFQADLLGIQLDTLEKEFTENFRVIYPVEAYRSYQAFSSPTLYLTKNAQVNHQSKSRTLYYQPVMDKEFDFVFNPILVEPNIQILYELKVKVHRLPKAPPQVREVIKKEREYYLLNPNGEIKSVQLQP
ncbi:MAG: SIMPL domain-containing protein [Bacteroidota bacterium]